MSKSREQLNKMLGRIDLAGKRVLDIGVQDKPTSRLTHGSPAQYLTIDIDQQWNPTIIADLNIQWYFSKKGSMPNDLGIEFMDYFDTVFCIEVLEHCWNPVQAIQNMANCLAPGGTLYISTPFINPHHDIVDYLRFTNEWYRDVLPKFGFPPEEISIEERVATTGRQQLEEFYKVEGMKISRIRPEHNNYSYPVGYYVIATKSPSLLETNDGKGGES